MQLVGNVELVTCVLTEHTVQCVRLVMTLRMCDLTTMAHFMYTLSAVKKTNTKCCWKNLQSVGGGKASLPCPTTGL